MIKSFALASALLISGLGATAAEVGTRHSSGSSVRNITRGHEYTNVRGYNQYGSTTESTAREVSGHLPSSGRGIGRGRSVDYTAANSTTSAWERGGSAFNGRSSNNFNGTDYSTFSESSTFAR